MQTVKQDLKANKSYAKFRYMPYRPIYSLAQGVTKGVTNPPAVKGLR